MKLAHKIAAVTGAGSGIGQAIALSFAAEGAHVYAFDVDEEGLKDTVMKAGYGQTLTTGLLDVSDSDQVQQSLKMMIEQSGRLDILVNNAGIGVAGTIPETDENDWHRIIAVNLTGVYLMCKYAIPIMQKQGEGNIINMASIVGMVGVKDRAAYAASKGGVIGLTKGMAVDHAGEGIRINCICPGTVDSPWVGRILADRADPVGDRQSMEARQPIGRMGTPEEIAHAALYLADPKSAFVHGSALIIDGGLSAQ